MENNGKRRSQRKATRRDLPGFCLVFAAIFALSAVALPIASRLDIASARAARSNLQMISGQVELVSHTYGGKTAPQLEILVRGSDDLHHLWQEDLTKDVPALKSLRVGDLITAMARPTHRLGRDLDWLWELRRDGVVLLSVEETTQYLERRYVRNLRLASGAAVLSVALLILGVVLRRHFGAWHDLTTRWTDP
jgi:hypothetical protein